MVPTLATSDGVPVRYDDVRHCYVSPVTGSYRFGGHVVTVVDGSFDPGNGTVALTITGGWNYGRVAVSELTEKAL